MTEKTLGDRMKEYENIWRVKLPRKTNVIIRVDGKAFHTYTKDFDKPFDGNLMKAMTRAAFLTSNNIQGFKVAYIQSDECSFYINDKDDIKTEAWFDNTLQKICSITASSFTAYYNNIFQHPTRAMVKVAMFDARAFILPSDEEVYNYFLWRARDWERNSLNMYCETFFSHKELHGKSNEQRHEMLYKIGKNWAKDLTEQQKNGTFITKDNLPYYIPPSYKNISEFIQREELSIKAQNNL